jgi:hypothetical protein
MTPGMEDLRRSVFRRDGDCLARRLDRRATPCRNRYGMRIERYPVHPRDLTLEHVQSGYGSMGLRAPDDEQHCVALCPGHHFLTEAGGLWATSHKDLERSYLDSLYGENR